MKINKTSALQINKGNFDKFMILSRECKPNISWWKSNIMDSFAPSIVLNNDASLAGWGASMARTKTGGLFTSKESQLHINILELKAAFFRLKALRNNFHKIHIVNTSAVAAINKMGSRRLIDMDQVVHLICNFILKHDNGVTTTNILGIFVEEADTELSKHETRIECMINRKYFEKIIQCLNFKPTVELFSIRLNTQLPHFISLRPDHSSR